MFNLGVISMKKTLVALAALAAVSAFAQSSVTIYGRVDAAITKPGGAPARLDAGNGTSRLGFRGVEDLGGGMRATFDLQHRFQVETGSLDGGAAGRPFWQGNSFVGLGGGWGDVHLGRRLTAYRNVDNVGDAFGVERVGSLSANTVASDTRGSNGANGAGLGRTDQIYYQSPNFGGLVAGVSLGLKTGDVNPVTTGAAALFSTSLAYSNGPMLLAFGYEKNRSKDIGYTIGGQYDFGAARLFAGYVSNDPVGAVKATKTMQIGVNVPVGAAVVKAGYMNVKPPVGASTNKLGIGADYALSKRTKLFATFGKPKGVSASFDMGVQHNF
jgi:predicted porin